MKLWIDTNGCPLAHFIASTDNPLHLSRMTAEVDYESYRVTHGDDSVCEIVEFNFTEDEGR